MHVKRGTRHVEATRKSASRKPACQTSVISLRKKPVLLQETGAID
jgi:hypothetical protein